MRTLTAWQTPILLEFCVSAFFNNANFKIVTHFLSACTRKSLYRWSAWSHLSFFKTHILKKVLLFFWQVWKMMYVDAYKYMHRQQLGNSVCIVQLENNTGWGIRGRPFILSLVTSPFPLCADWITEYINDTGKDLHCTDRNWNKNDIT